MEKAEQLYFLKKGKARLILGFLGPPAIWLIQLLTNFVLVTVSCEIGTRVWLFVASAVFLLASIAAGVLSWVNWRTAGLTWPGPEDGGILGRSRFLSLLGVMTSALFSLIILAQATAVLFLHPCLE
jgi:hypothetical protein